MSQGFFAQINEDWVTNGKDSSKPGFRALAVYRFGNWRMKIKSKFLRAPFSILYRMLFRRVRNWYSIELPYSAKIGRRLIIEHQGAIVLHGNARIGDDCIIRQGVTIGNRYTNRPDEAPILGDRVNVGAGAKILGNVTLGHNVSVGANAVVLHNVETNIAVVGIPAKPIIHKNTQA